MKTKTLWALAAFALALLLGGATTVPTPANGTELGLGASTGVLAIATPTAGREWNALGHRGEPQNSLCVVDARQGEEPGFWKRLWERIKRAFRRLFVERIMETIERIIEWFRENCEYDPEKGEANCRDTF